MVDFEKWGKEKIYSFDPMKFGTEKDFETALTELRWVRKNRGKLTNQDFTTVSRKYNFPVDFLRKGLSGLTLEDYMIRTSRWFPIMYAWNSHLRNMRNELLRVAYKHAHSWIRMYLVIILLAWAGSFFLGGMFSLGFDLRSILMIGLSLVLFMITIYFQLKPGVDSWAELVRNVKRTMLERGFDRTVSRTLDLVYFNYGLAGAIVESGEYERRPALSAYLVGTKDMPKEVKTRKTWKSRLARWFSKSPEKPQMDKVPVFLVENPDQEYYRRIKNLLK